MSTERFTSQIEKPSLTRKALVSVLGGLGIFASTHIFGAYADSKANEQEYAESQKSQEFDINRAKIVQLINLDEQNQPEN